MGAFGCFGREGKDDVESASDGNASDMSSALMDGDTASMGPEEFRSPELTEGFPTEPRAKAKSRFKGAVNAIESRRKENPGKGTSTHEMQFMILAKIFSEEDAFDELRKLSEKPSAVLQILPFILNSMLYGSLQNDDGGGHNANYAAGAGKKKKDVESLSVVQKMTPMEYESKLEEVIFEICRKSVHAALHCEWYLVSSLSLGPKELYHRTMRLLLSMESVVMVNQTANNKLFSNAQVSQIEAQGDEGDNLKEMPSKRTQVLGQTELQLLKSESTARDNEDRIEVDTEPKRGDRLLLKVDTMGDGVGDVQLALGKVKGEEKEHLDKWLEARKERSNFFHAEMDFVKCLTDLSYDLYSVARADRKDILRGELEKLNDFIPKSAFIPVLGYQHRVLRIIPSEAFVFSTKERCPYLISFEVERISGGEGMQETPRRSGRKRSSQIVDDEVGNVEPNKPEETFAFSSAMDNLSKANMNENEEEEDDELPQNNSDDVYVSPQIIEAFGEPFSEKQERIRKSSQYSQLPGWGLASCIVKSRDQLRQEMFAMRMIKEFASIFQNAKLRAWVKPYQLLATSADSGFIETLQNSKSLSSLRSEPNFTTLSAFFKSQYGQEHSSQYKRAVDNFSKSMAGYSVVTYILAIKDRHNGNLMLDSDGHIVHIDFGFLLSNSPGGNREFERAPFKLTQEMIDLMGGPNSSFFRRYRKMGRKAYAEACKHVNRIMLEVDMMFAGNENMPCFFAGRRTVLEGLRERMMPNATSAERVQRFDALLHQSMNNWTTRWYDRYQKCFTGVA